MGGTKIKGTAFSIASAVLWGFNPLFARTVYADGGSAVTLAFFRMLIGACFMALAHSAVVHTSLRVSGSELKKLLICSIGYAVTPVLLFSSYDYLPSGLSTTIHFVYPVLVIAGAVLFCHEKIKAIKLLCSGLCLAGIFCFYTPGGGVSPFGIWIAFASGATYAFYILYLSASGLLDMPIYKATCWLNLISAAGIGLFALVSGQAALPASPAGFGVMALYALAAAAASVLFQLGTKYVGAQSASLLSTFEPLTSVLVGVAVYHESLTAQSLLGVACILISVVLISLSGGST